MDKLKIASRILSIAVALTGMAMLVGWMIAPTIWVKPLSYLATMILPFVPDFFRLAKVNFSMPLFLAYEIFLVVAMVLGIDLNWYSEVLVTANNGSYYDKIVHFFSGILVAVAAEELFERYRRQSGAKKPVRWFQMLFLISAVALIAVGWECYEFLYDEICGGHMQELVKSGVNDTMWDMIVSLLGGGISIICIVWAEETSLLSTKEPK